MKLSPGEKLIISMLVDLYKHHNVRGQIDPDFVMNSIADSHEWGLTWEYPFLIGEEEAQTPPVVIEVSDILTAWTAVETTWARMTDAQRDQVIQTGILFSDKPPTFDGFDGNLETEHFSVASYLIADLRRFPHFAGRELNSHAPNLDRHLAMAERFKPLRSKLPDDLTPADLVTILRQSD